MVIGKYKVGKHFDLEIQDAVLAFSGSSSWASATENSSASVVFRKGMRHGQLTGLGRDNAARNHRCNEIAFARCLAVDQFFEPQPPHGDAHRLHMPMRQRTDAVEAAARRRNLLAFEHERLMPSKSETHLRSQEVCG